MKLTITFTDGHHIKIKFHESMKRWSNHLQNISSKYKYSLNDKQSAIGTDSIDNDTDKSSNVYQILSDTISKLEDVRPIGFAVPDKFTYDQEVLNRLHRYYTDSASVVDTESEVFKLVSKINYCVHELEGFTDNRNTGYTGDLWFHVHDYPIPMDCWIDLKDQEQENYKFFEHDYKYRVRLDRSILGKCVLQSFEENDNPNAKDCTGRAGSFGGFFIDTNNKLKEVYQSNKFIEWCKRHGKEVNQMPLEFVIGCVNEFSDAPDSYKSKTLAKLDFETVPSSIG
jgi:hypothetical protein|tara:strand:+ start:15 stop:863 length:849 start_codon:yes stop_codon:yes gene_type:complete